MVNSLDKRETDGYYNTPLMLILLYISGGLLWGAVCAAVFTTMAALSRFVPVLRDWAGNSFIALVCFGVLFAVVMTLSILSRREIIPFIPTRKLWMKYLVKVSQSVSKRIFLDSGKAVRSFIRLSNEFVLNEIKGCNKNKILILLPHCIQLNSCVFRITSDIKNCRKCSKCVVSTFVGLSEKFGFDVYVSTGGTMARMAVQERHPDLILAVACERDLLSGIRDTLALPVIGILNELPNGPCYNTTVDPIAVEDVLRRVF
jgi:hypothetical protein